MSNITFAEIMEFYPEHNNSVYEDLKKDYQRGCLIPFVGAGLSVFCGYLNWPDILKYLAKFFYNKDKQTQIETMIDDGELLQAAQEIYDHYPRMLRELQKIVDYEKIHNCDTCKLYASAAYVLPCLFRSSLVMTTNFDRVLEEVYDRHHAKFGKIVSPYEPDLLTQIRQANLHCLFKLHGDIGPEIHDAEKLVFTQTQYDRAYAADGPLMQELSQWFLNKR
ncbi:MAG: SIR2 family protein, partial [Agathobacter sp.]